MSSPPSPTSNTSPMTRSVARQLAALAGGGSDSSSCSSSMERKKHQVLSASKKKRAPEKQDASYSSSSSSEEDEIVELLGKKCSSKKKTQSKKSSSFQKKKSMKNSKKKRNPVGVGEEEDDVREEVIGKKGGKTNGLVKPNLGTTRLPNFTIEEDIALVKAYVNVSHNPKCGADKTADRFWAEITKKYHEVLADVLLEDEGLMIVERTPSSLQYRYQKHVQRDYNKWMKYYKSICNKRPSGMTDDNLLKKASEMYEESEGKPFCFSASLKLLLEIPRGDAMVRKLSAGGSKEKVCDTFVSDKEYPTNNPHNNQPNVEVNDLYAPTGSNIARPMGRTKAKYLATKDRIKESDDKREESKMSLVLELLAKQTSTMATEHGAIVFEMKRKQDFMESVTVHQQRMEMVKFYMEMKNFSKAQEIMQSIEEEIAMSSASVSITEKSQLSSLSITEKSQLSSLSLSLSVSEKSGNTKTIPFPSLTPTKISRVIPSDDVSDSNFGDCLVDYSSPSNKLLSTIEQADKQTKVSIEIKDPSNITAV